MDYKSKLNFKSLLTRISLKLVLLVQHQFLVAIKSFMTYTIRTAS
jgi:hypothetical protein